MTDNHYKAMQNEITPTEGENSDQTTDESSLDDAACSGSNITSVEEMRDFLRDSDASFHPEIPDTDWDLATDTEVREHYFICNPNITMKYIVAKIHNQSLVSVEAFATLEEAENVIRDKFFHQFDRVLDDEENDDLENLLEVINEDDDDNHFTFSIGILGE